MAVDLMFIRSCQCLGYRTTRNRVGIATSNRRLLTRTRSCRIIRTYTGRSRRELARPSLRAGRRARRTLRPPRRASAGAGPPVICGSPSRLPPSACVSGFGLAVVHGGCRFWPVLSDPRFVADLAPAGRGSCDGGRHRNPSDESQRSMQTTRPRFRIALHR